MSPTFTRRRFAAATASAAATALAGCNSLPFTDGSGGGSPARDWLYDPEEYVESEEFYLSVEFKSPSRLDAVDDELNDELRNATAPLYTDGLDADEVDWSMRASESLFKGPYVVANGGSFDVDDAEDAAAASSSVTDPDGDDVASVGDLEVVEYEPGIYGAYADGEAVAIQGADALDVEAFVADGTDGSAGVVNALDGYGALLDAVGFDHTAQLWFNATEEGPFGGGYGYTVDGETTTVRWASVDGFTADEMESTVDDIDALRDVTVEADGDLVVLEGTADTDRLGLRGQVFQLLQAPYE